MWELCTNWLQLKPEFQVDQFVACFSINFFIDWKVFYHFMTQVRTKFWNLTYVENILDLRNIPNVENNNRIAVFPSKFQKKIKIFFLFILRYEIELFTCCDPYRSKVCFSLSLLNSEGAVLCESLPNGRKNVKTWFTENSGPPFSPKFL